MTQKSTGARRQTAKSVTASSAGNAGNERTLTMSMGKGNRNLRRKTYNEFSEFIEQQ